MTKKSILTLTLAAVALFPVACTIKTTSNDGSGGSDSGGSTSTGGKSSTGGSSATGGSSTNGGSSATGGSSTNGGQSAAGGSSSTGGASSNGGQSTVGGASSTGGASTAGGSGAGGSSSTVAKTRVDVTDDINAATTWTANNVYVISASSTISVNAALTIEPGTVVKFQSGAALYVDTTGQLNAIGSATAHIVFTGIKDDSAGGDTNADGSATKPTIGDWSTIGVVGNSSSFDYAEVRYADSAVALAGKNQSVKHTTFTFNTLALDSTNVAVPASSTTIANNVFFKNTHPLTIDAGTAVDATNTFHNPSASSEVNTFQAIEVTTDIGNTVTWSNTEVAYVLSGAGATYYVNSPAVLTLATGVVVKLDAGAELYVNTGATLNVGATTTFTSYKDDSKLGDSNGDGTATTPADNDWSGVYVATTDTWLTTNVFFDNLTH